MDLYQVDANKSCLEFKLCDNVWKIMKVFIQDVVVEISIKKKKPTSSHDTIEIIKHKTTVKTDSSTQLCCRSFKFYKARSLQIENLLLKLLL